MLLGTSLKKPPSARLSPENRHALEDTAFHRQPPSHSSDQSKGRKTAEGKLLSTTRIPLLLEPLPSRCFMYLFIYLLVYKEAAVPVPAEPALALQEGVGMESEKEDGWILNCS